MIQSELKCDLKMLLYNEYYNTMCPRSLDPISIVSYYIKWVKRLLGHTVQWPDTPISSNILSPIYV